MSLSRCHSHFLHLMFILFLSQAPSANTISFSFTSFEPGESNIVYDGDAKPINGAIELNDVDRQYRVGRAYYAYPVPIWESSKGLLTNFTTRFSFTIYRVPPHRPGSGLAFFLASVNYPIPPNSAGGCFGLFSNNGTRSYPQKTLVTVEFDSYVNQWDPSVTHVGINNNSISSSNFTEWDNLSHIGNKTNVLVTYSATSKKLSVFWSYAEEPTYDANSSISYKIDLTKAVPEKVIMGFSASTGGHIERHTINSWEFSSFLEDIEKTGGKLWILITSACFCFLTVGIVIGWIIVIGKSKRNPEKIESRISLTEDLEKDAFSKRLCYQELVTATDNFSIAKRLGQGGSGEVYWGNMSRLGCLVAVKRILAETELYESLFVNEVKIISRLKHRNLVQLMGWCHEKDELLLVYEYMQNGSLDHHLFGNRRPLPWSIRYKIALGLASALRYLHEEAEPHVLHRDIKAANVLLNTDFSTKLGDFGVAKLINSYTQNEATKVVGTVGYLAPEYLRDGYATKESDLFSFGIVCLEIACGRRAHREPLVKSVWELYKAGSIIQAADTRLEMNFESRELERLVSVGLSCTHPVDKERPSAGRVIQLLNFEATLPKLPQELHDPAFVPRPLSPDSNDSANA